MNQAEPAPAERVPTRDTPKRVRRVRKNPPTPKAGRNLPAAIGVGLAMLLAVLVDCFSSRWDSSCSLLLSRYWVFGRFSGRLKRREPGCRSFP